MAHTKAGGAAKRTVNVAGKRLGVKKFAGQTVISGNIIVRQRGTQFHPGLNTMIGRDHTIFSVASGVVSFREMTKFKKGQKWVDVLPHAEAPKVTVKAAKTEVVEVEAPKTKAAKPKAKKATKTAN